MSLEAAYLMPHPPIVVEAVGGSEIEKCKDTQQAMIAVGKQISDIKPDTIIVITPHGAVFSDAISINAFDHLYGDLGQFGHSEVAIEKENNLNLVEEIYSNAMIENIPIAKINDSLVKKHNINKALDHGVIVPLYYPEKVYQSYQLVHINYGLLSYDELYKFGMELRRSIESIEEKVVLIASGDLSHKLSNQGPYTYAKEGKEFDEQIINNLVNKKTVDIITMKERFCKKAGECGKRSIDILLGTLDGFNYDIQKLSYEGPFGVGYGVVAFTNLYKDETRDFFETIKNKKKGDLALERKNEDPYVKLARKTIEMYVKEDKTLDISDEDLPKEMLNRKAGVFVSIKNSGGLRGCIGTIQPTKDCVAKEIVRNAIEASTNDPRFYAISESELDELKITVDILKTPEKIEDHHMLDPEKYGVIVQSGYKRALLLPRLEGIDTIKKQLKVVLNKAGISKNEDYSVERFEVVRHE